MAVVLDALYGWFHDVRPIDWLVFGVDLAILLFIFIEDLIKFRSWRAQKKAEKHVEERLDELNAVTIEALRRFVVDDLVPPGDVCNGLRRHPALVQRDHLRGWRLNDEWRDVVRKWIIRRG